MTMPFAVWAIRDGRLLNQHPELDVGFFAFPILCTSKFALLRALRRPEAALSALGALQAKNMSVLELHHRLLSRHIVNFDIHSLVNFDIHSFVNFDAHSS